VFKAIFDRWAMMVPTLQEDPRKINTLKTKIVDTFYAWIRLKLPDEVFENLVTDCPNLMNLVFSELDSQEEDNLTCAVNCIVELIRLSGSRKRRYDSIQDLVV